MKRRRLTHQQAPFHLDTAARSELVVPNASPADAGVLPDASKDIFAPPSWHSPPHTTSFRIPASRARGTPSILTPHCGERAALSQATSRPIGHRPLGGQGQVWEFPCPGPEPGHDVPRLQAVSAGAGFDTSYLGTPQAARDFLRLARRAGPIGNAGGGIAHRMLLIGSEGSGKKTLTQALASELGAGWACLTWEQSRASEPLVCALDALDAQAYASGRFGVVYFEAVGTPRFAHDADAALPAYERWLRAWTLGERRHLYLMVGIPSPRWAEQALADAVVLQCHLRAPDADVRSLLWQRALADAEADGAVSVALAPEALDKVVVRPSAGFHGGDVVHTLQLAIRAAILESPDAATVSLTVEHMRAGIHLRQARLMAAATTQLDQLLF